MLYEEIFKALNKARVKYVVAGGVAVVLHGYARFTADLDLIVYLEEKNIERFFGVVGKLGYKPRIPVTKEQFKNKENRRKWIKDKGMVVFSFFHPKEHLKNIDIFVKEPLRFDLIMKKTKKISVKNFIIPLLSLEHLIKLKKKANRPQDIIDITNLKAIQKIK